MRTKRLYIIKKHVWATSLEQAIKGKGKIVEVSDTEREKEPSSEIGFNKNGKRK